MKRGAYLFLLLTAVALYSCEEEPIPVLTSVSNIPLTDTNYLLNAVPAAQDKNVLIEDLTGVRCPTCPAGHETIHKILADHPKRTYAIAVHPGYYLQAAPLDSVNFNFNTSFGGQIRAMYNPQGIPFGIIDRKLTSNTVGLWEGYVSQQLGEATPVNLDLKIEAYDPATREFVYEVKLVVTKALTGPLFLSTVITESHIIAGQEKVSVGTIHDYEHNHILRTMPQFKQVLNPAGKPGLEAGRVFVKRYRIKVEDKWNPDNCELVAYVHIDGEVYQTMQVKIK